MKVNSILPVDDFCGSTFPTPKGGILTVVGHNGLKGNKKKYYCICSVCHTEDPELHTDLFETYKGNLVKCQVPCGCSPTPRYNEQQRIVLISRECKIRGHEFRGFVGGKYSSVKTYLILFCPEHGEWTSTSYNNYMTGYGCPSCGGTVKISEEEAITNIQNKCQSYGHEFRGFVGGKYSRNTTTYLILYCPKHGEWTSTRYSNYMNNVSCPSCGSEYRAESRKIQNPEELIIDEASKRGHEFRGFVGEKFDKAINTYLIMYCPEHGEWTSTTYNGYMNSGSSCPCCSQSMISEKQKIQNPEELIIDEASKRGHEFRGFVGGKYNGAKTTYLIMYCPEHGEWTSTSYNNYMNHGRGCPSCAETGYTQSKPGTFYIIHYEYEGEVFLKYGITNRDTTSRMVEHTKDMKNVTSTILYSKEYEDGTIPFKMEQAVNAKYKGGVTTCLTSGNTETAPHCDFNEVKLLAESVLKGL